MPDLLHRGKMGWKGCAIVIQRFIELGEGYSDIYELCELMKTNQHRYHNVCILSTTKNNVLRVSIA